MAEKTKRKDFIFAVDLDGCVVDYYSAIRPIAAKWLNKRIDELTHEFTYGFPEWGIPEMGELQYSYMHRYAVKQKKIFKLAPPIEGASYYLRKLSSNGVHIRIATHRLYVGGTHEMVVKQTVAWLEEHAIPYLDLCFLKDKTSVNADIYLDDSPHNLQAFREKGMNYIIFDNSTNKDCAGTRATSWERVYELVMKEMEARNI